MSNKMELSDLEVRDLSKERKLVLESGNVITFKCTDPYGFWTVHYEQGMMPKKLKGQYTTFDYAYADVKKYLSTLFNEVVDERNTEAEKQKPLPQKPEFKYKSPPPPRS